MPEGGCHSAPKRGSTIPWPFVAYKFEQIGLHGNGIDS